MSSPVMAFPLPDLQNVHDLDLGEIAEYVEHYEIKCEEAYSTSRLSLLDSLACAFYSLSYPDCTKMLGPVVPNTVVPYGTRVPATAFELDPVLATFNIGCMVRWMDYNDETPNGHAGHPSDNLCGILACADYLSRVRVAQGKAPLVMRDVLTALIKAYEIEGVIGLDPDFNYRRLDHEWLIRVATAAVVTRMFGGTKDEIINAVSQAFADLSTLRLYRDEPTWGTRKSWGGPDSASRGVWLALITLKGEMGYPTVLTAKKEGVYDVLFDGKPVKVLRPYGSWVMENTIFKIPSPSEIFMQSVLECAMKLHPLVKDRLDDIEKITITTCHPIWHTANVKAQLTNPAARDHSVQYGTAVVLLFGKLTGDDYQDRVAADPRLDALCNKMVVVVDKDYVADADDPKKYAMPNAIQIQFKDGTSTEKVKVEYPLGHVRRRTEGIPVLIEKFKTSLDPLFPAKQKERILSSCLDQRRLEATPVNEFMEVFARPENPLRVSSIGIKDQLRSCERAHGSDPTA